MKNVDRKFGLVAILVLLALVGCRRGQGRRGGGDTTATSAPPILKSFQFAFENTSPYGLDFETGFAVSGETLAYGDTRAGLEADMVTGYFIQARPGKAAVLYLRHEDPTEGGVGLHVLSLELPALGAGTDTLSAKAFKGVLYIFYNTPEGDFFQARRGEGVVVLDMVTADSAKGSLRLSLLGKRAEARVLETLSSELRLVVTGRFALPVRTPKEVAQIQKAREAQAASLKPLRP